MIKNLKIAYFIFLIFLALSCNKNEKNFDENDNPMKGIEIINQTQWDNLGNKKIYFGHQSVGYDIIDGVEFILNNNPDININIIEGSKLSLFENPVFAHSKNGLNGDPKSKIDAFYKIVDEGLGGKVDIAGFKFCYADFNKNTDITNIFEYYKNKMNKISQKYPNVEIIHFTVPLRAIQTGPKAWVKKILNKDVGIKDNYARQQFNELLINNFNGLSIFDLAKHESTNLDKIREYTFVNDKKVYSMVPDYTIDGGHLSNKGKYYIGTQYLLFLTDITKGKRKD